MKIWIMAVQHRGQIIVEPVASEEAGRNAIAKRFPDAVLWTLREIWMNPTGTVGRGVGIPGGTSYEESMGIIPIETAREPKRPAKKATAPAKKAPAKKAPQAHFRA